MPKVQKTRSGRIFNIPPAPERAVDASLYPNYHKPYRGLPPEIRIQIWQWCLDRHWLVRDVLAKYIADKPQYRKVPTMTERRWQGQSSKHFSKKDFLAMGYDRSWAHNKLFTPLIAGGSGHWHIRALDQRTASEIKDVLRAAPITLNLEYMDLGINTGLTDAEFWGHFSMGFTRRASQRHRNRYELREIFYFVPSHILTNITVLNYRPYRDERTRASIFILLTHITDAHGLNKLRELNLIIDSRDLRLLTENCPDQEQTGNGMVDTRGRPSQYWATDNGYFTLYYGGDIDWLTEEDVAGDFHSLEYVLFAQWFRRFSIHVGHLTETQRTIMSRRPFGFHVPQSWVDHGFSATTRWEKVRRQWNAVATVEYDPAFECECHPRTPD